MLAAIREEREPLPDYKAIFTGIKIKLFNLVLSRRTKNVALFLYASRLFAPFAHCSPSQHHQGAQEKVEFRSKVSFSPPGRPHETPLDGQECVRNTHKN